MGLIIGSAARLYITRPNTKPSIRVSLCALSIASKHFADAMIDGHTRAAVGKGWRI
jgi:hypothetical protein